MKKSWKWIIGIVLGLVILTVLIGLGFMARSNFHGYRADGLDSRGFSERGPGMMPFGGFCSHMRGPGMPGHGWMRFGGFFSGLPSLGFLVLVVLGIIWLARSLRTAKPVEAAAAMPATVVNSCKKCGKPIQNDWMNCPYCGKRV